MLALYRVVAVVVLVLGGGVVLFSSWRFMFGGFWLVASYGGC